jgi:SAM-dependent methyltransferase
MRRDVLTLRSFYATPLGQAARALVSRKLVEAWGDAHGLDVLGVGYATPFLDPFRSRARRVVAAMPAAQGVEVWPSGEANLACLAGEQELPFPSAFFDRIVVVHGLEESDAPGPLLAEVRRVLAPSGRMIAVVANRRGLWARAEETPFGHGRPFSREQLEEAVIQAGLAPEAWSRALYVPPLAMLARHADVIEQVGSRLAAPMAGLILLEAVKQTFAVKPRGLKAPAAVRALRPAAAGAASSSHRGAADTEGLGGGG